MQSSKRPYPNNTMQYVDLFPDIYCDNRNIIPQNCTNESKTTHNVDSTAGKKIVKFHCLNLFGFFDLNYGKSRLNSLPYKLPYSRTVVPR